MLQYDPPAYLRVDLFTWLALYISPSLAPCLEQAIYIRVAINCPSVVHIGVERIEEEAKARYRRPRAESASRSPTNLRQHHYRSSGN